MPLSKIFAIVNTLKVSYCAFNQTFVTKSKDLALTLQAERAERPLKPFRGKH